MTDLWTEATRDIEAEDAVRRLTAARLDTEPLLPFLKQASSVEDFDMRVSMAEERLLATAGDQAAQIVAEARTEVMERLAAGRCRCGKKSCSCTGSCKCSDNCTCAPCNQAKTSAKVSFRIEADASGGYYVVNEQTGADVGSYPTQSAAEHAAQNQPGLEVEPTGNPAAPGVSAPTSVAPQGPTGDNAGESTAPAGPEGDTASGSVAPPEALGSPEQPAALPPITDNPAAAAPMSAPTGEGDAGDDSADDAQANDESSDPTKQAKKVVAVGQFKVALEEGVDPLLPLLQLMDNGQGQAEQPSYHTDSQQQLGAPSNHANGEIGTSNPEGDFMSAPDAKQPYKASKVDNPFTKQAGSGLGWPATHEPGHNPFPGMPSQTWPHKDHGPVSVPTGLHHHIAQGELVPRYVGEQMDKFKTRKGAEAGPFKVGDSHTKIEKSYAQYHPQAKDGWLHVKMPATVLGVHSEESGDFIHHKALVRKANGDLDVRSHSEDNPNASVPDYHDAQATSQSLNPRANYGAEHGLR